MKKLCIYLMAVFLLGFISCQNDEEFDINTPMVSESDKAIIEQLNFNVATIVDMGSYYLVEGDIALDKEHLAEYLLQENNPLSRQARTTNLVSLTNVQNIRVQVQSNVPTAWRTATLDALKKWNEIPASAVRFVETPSGSADIVISYSSINSPKTIARASWPANNKPGPTIVINTNHNDLDSSIKLFTMVHELGHCLGLRHDTWKEEGASNIGAIQIPGTPARDDQSVMRPSADFWNGFSQYDIIAIKYLYGIGYISPSSTATIPINSSINYSFNGISLNSNVKISWVAVSQNISLSSGQGTANSTFKTQSPGVASVKAIVNFYGKSVILEHSGVLVRPIFPPLPSGSEGVYIGYAQDGTKFSAPMVSGASVLEYSPCFKHLGGDKFEVYLSDGVLIDSNGELGYILIWDPVRRTQIRLVIFCAV